MRKSIAVSAVVGSLLLIAPPHSAAQNDSDRKYLRSPMPENWAYTSELIQTLPSDDNWWKRFNDPVLDSLISIGIDNNFDIVTAIARMNMAMAQIKQAEAGYYPTINLNAGYTHEQNAGAISGKNVKSVNSGYFSLGAEMNWEIDLFGKITGQVKGKKAQYRASRAEYMATMVSLSAEIATCYFNLRTAQRQLYVTTEHLASEGRVVEIAKARFEAGLVSKLDVTQALTVYYSTEATIPQLQTSVKQAVNAIAILLGVYPEEISHRLKATNNVPEYRQLIPAGIPANLLRRRPDIVVAEQNIAAYIQASEVAKRDFLSDFSINGSIGVGSQAISGLFGDNSLDYRISPTLTWTLFDGFARKAAVTESKEQIRIGIDNYNQTVMTAVQEVDNAMIAYSSSLRAIDSYTKVIEQCDESFHLSLNLYKDGLTPFTNVVDAQINSLTYANSLVATRGDALVNLVNLYKALGGSPFVE